MPSTDIKKTRLSIVLLFSIGLVPVIIAYIVFLYFPQYLPTTTTNQGELLSPSISAEQVNLPISEDLNERKWSMLIPLDSSCDESCESRFYLAHQINIALGKEAGRVKRILISHPLSDRLKIETLQTAYPAMEWFELDKQQIDDAFNASAPDFFGANYIFLMDPNGNIMMFYIDEKVGQPMLRDIKFLLKVSNIG